MGCDIHLHVETKIGEKWQHYSHSARTSILPLILSDGGRTRLWRGRADQSATRIAFWH